MTRHRKAFTLVELLVVIGIIALLISILLPALNRARGQAKQIVCESQLRQIGAAMMLHANEHRNHFPLAGMLWPNKFGHPADCTPVEVQDPKQVNYSYFPDPGRGGRPVVAPIPFALAPYLGYTKQMVTPKDYESSVVFRIFTCPSNVDEIQTGGIQKSNFMASSVSGYSGPLLESSYAFSEAVLGWADGPGTRGSHSRERGNLARMPHPADLVLLADAAPRGEAIADFWMVFNDNTTKGSTLYDFYMNNVGGDNADPDLFDKNRHYGNMNVLFCDGHAETLHIPDTLNLGNVSNGLP